MRTHYCARLSALEVDQTVDICGWVSGRRDHGGVIFLDIKDKTGVIQTVFDPEYCTEDVFQQADSLRSEFVIKVQGKVRKRPEGMVNAQLKTGEIEILAVSLILYNASKTPPFPLSERDSVSEDVRAKYRYFDLRSTSMQDNMRFRSQLVTAMRRILDESEFLEMETPILTRMTPEGARDYLVPSRLHAGAFYALPQSPQLFKQLLMVAGFDRYYQIARCFRDEDLRADRQPEFTQLDVEMSFVTERQVMEISEQLVVRLFSDLLSVQLPTFPVLTWHECIHKYGTDKPDLRNPLHLVDVAHYLKDVDFQVFAGPANDPKSRVVVVRVPKGGEQLSRKQIDEYTKFVGRYGAKGLAYIKVESLEQGIDGLRSPILKFLPEEVVQKILQDSQCVNGDLLFFGAGQSAIVNDSMSALCQKLALDLELLSVDAWAPCWVVDWPMFEEGDGRLVAMHHPFTQPNATLEEFLENPMQVKARAYDLVLNGHELGGGSVRISDASVQSAVFDSLGIDEATRKAEFGFLLDALTYGCPPHAGIAFGVDRLVMLMLGLNSIRDVIAFPKTQAASCLLTKSPSAISNSALKDMGLHVKTEIEKSP